MIESEEKRNRLLDMINHWAKHTKVKPYLREYDIPGLVCQILGEFYNVKCTCQHLINSRYQKEYIVDYKDNDGSEVRVVSCEDCLKWYKETFKDVIITEDCFE